MVNILSFVNAERYSHSSGNKGLAYGYMAYVGSDRLG